MNPFARFSGAFTPWADVWVRSAWRVQLHASSGQARLLDPAGMPVMSGCKEDCLSGGRRLAPSAGLRRGCVLLHGLAHHRGAMQRTEAAVAEAGWAVANVGHPSVRLPVEVHARAASQAAAALAEDGAEEVAFVGHSLGGLIAREAMARAGSDGWNRGALVVLGSPASGSAIAHLLRRFPLYKAVLGPCGQTVTPAGASLVAPAQARGVGVIAGGNGRGGWNPLLRGDNDGVVSVSETRMPDAETGFLLVRSLHTPLARHPDAVAATVAFLCTGRMAA